MGKRTVHKNLVFSADDGPGLQERCVNERAGVKINQGTPAPTTCGHKGGSHILRYAYQRLCGSKVCGVPMPNMWLWVQS